MFRKFWPRRHGAMPLSAPAAPDPLRRPQPGTTKPVTGLKEQAKEERATERWADEGGSPPPAEAGNEHGPSDDYVD